MKYITSALAMAGLGLALTACATTPPEVTAHYYFPRAETQVLVTETVGCSPPPGDGKQAHRLIRAVMTAAPTTTNGADMAWLNSDGTVRQGSLRYRDLSSAFSDEDITVTLTADGRLVGINATNTGEGDTIVKNLVTVAGALALVAGPRPGVAFVSTPEDDACGIIDNYAAIGQGDPSKVAPTVTLTYSVAFTYDFVESQTPKLKADTDAFPNYGKDSTYADQSALTARITMVPDPAVDKVVRDLEAKLPGKIRPNVQLVTTSGDLKFLNAVQTPKTVDKPYIELAKVAMLAVRVTGYVGNLGAETQIWSAIIPAPTHYVYLLPLSKPVNFGKTAFGLSLSDYGSVTSLHYGSTSAGPDLTDAAGAIAKALPQRQSAEDKSNDIKGQADLIAQQQRLISCEVDPTNCK